MDSCRGDRARGVTRRSPMPSWSVWLSRRSCSISRLSGASCASPPAGSVIFPYLPKQPGYNKRMRALAPQIVRLLNLVACSTPSWHDKVRLLDSTPIPCAASRETVKRSAFAGQAAYGYCPSHSRYFWGFRLYLLCASDGMPICFELAPANAPEREVAAEMLQRIDLHGYTVLADKGFAGADFEALMRELHAIFLRPDRKNEPARFGGLGSIRQWIESTID